MRVPPALSPTSDMQSLISDLPDIDTNSGDVFHFLILKFFNLIFNKGEYPHQWREYYVVFIPKPGRRDSLRPISLANNLLKIFEKLIHRRIEWWAERGSLFCKSQFGFRKGLSCTDSISTLTTSIQMFNKSRKFTGAAFLDIEGAFDRVRLEILLTLLAKFGLSPKILKFIKALTFRRHLIGFAAGINLQNRDTTIGLPQDSILSPILFNLYIAFSHSVLPDSVKILYYADDIAIYCTGGQLGFIKDQMNNALDGLFRVGDGNIRFSSTARFLSVILDSGLNWKAHVNHLRNRIMRRVNILKAIAGIRWGAHPSNLLNVYKGFIRPLLDWGCQSFNPLNEQLYLRDIEKNNICYLLDVYFAHSDLFEQIDSFHLPGYLDFPYECRHFDPVINTDLDGSRSESDGRVGCAAFSPELDLEHKERINNNCTIFEAEALTIHVLSNLENPVSTGILHRGILKIKRSLFECFKQAFEVHIYWIPSHRGIPGNERANALAKKSLRLPDTFLLSKCHYTNLYSKFKALSKSRASQTILAESHYKGTRYFNHVRDVLAPPWYSNRKNIKEDLPRLIITFISRLRSHHTSTKDHLFNKNITESSECSCGHPSQDMNHVFFHCPNSQDDSNLLITQLHGITPDIALDIPTLAFTNDTRIFRALHNFSIRNKLHI
ncbi:uncharacterized protein [Polyergus mexicanus]|uniref:uncharacterized protein n=1 Tax=Polyergus mexicanus TaxID=615972 RepID=UPI0038B60EFF